MKRICDNVLETAMRAPRIRINRLQGVITKFDLIEYLAATR